MRNSHWRGGNKRMGTRHGWHCSATMPLRLPDERECRNKKER
jgi:hypothetical protein